MPTAGKINLESQLLQALVVYRGQEATGDLPKGRDEMLQRDMHMAEEARLHDQQNKNRERGEEEGADDMMESGHSGSAFGRLLRKAYKLAYASRNIISGFGDQRSSGGHACACPVGNQPRDLDQRRRQRKRAR